MGQIDGLFTRENGPVAAALSPYARDITPVWSAWAEGRHGRRRRVCLRQQTTATGWRRQLPAVQFNRSRRDAGPLCARHHPRLVRLGGGSAWPQTPGLFAPADDRNGLATPTAGGAIQSQPTRRRPARGPRRCNGARLSETKVKADLACARHHPRLVRLGGGSAWPQTPGLFAPADDRNGLATPTAGGAIQSQPTRRRPARGPRRCNGARLSETKVKADLASRFSTRSARHLPPSSRKLTSVTICHELSDADQIIKFENGGTD